MKSRYFIAGCIIFLLPQLSFAHLVSTRFGEFYSGLIHPGTSLVHIVPWFALALLAGMQQRKTSRSVLLSFPTAIVIGTTLGCYLPQSELVSIINLGFFCVLGLLVLTARHLNPGVFILISLVFGLTQGYANGVNSLHGSDQFLYISGVTAAAYILMALVTAGAYLVSLQPGWGRIALRAAGSWIFAIGLMYGGFLLLAPVSSASV